jgi:antitoxin (DNA-binding transcriptional repressor) of toxin-antitoxin stability system
MKVTATQLRADLYRILDRVSKTGEEVEITRARGSLVIKPKVSERRSRRRRPRGNPKLIVGSPDDLIHMDWSKHWKPVL